MQQAECTRNCWITGAIAGLGVMLLVSGIGDTDWLGGLFLGALTCVLLSGLLVLLVADGQPAPYDPGLKPFRSVKSVVSATVEAPVSIEQSEVAAEQAARPQPAPKPVRKPAAVREKKAKKQDLKKINGIGPKIEQALNDLGITRYAQIADWTPAQEMKMASGLGRLGARIGTDNWVVQARDLMQVSDDRAAKGKAAKVAIGGGDD